MFVRGLNRDILGVIFDWGDTLVCPPGLTTDYERHISCLEALYHEFIAKDIFCVSKKNSTHWNIFKDNYEMVAWEQVRQTHASGREHKFEERFERTIALSFPEFVPNKESIRDIATNFGARMSQICTIIKDANYVLTRLAQKFKLGILSNYPHPPVVHSSLANFGLTTHFDAVTVSGEIGWAKPHRQAFDHIIDSVNIPPKCLLFVGDDIINDIEGARIAGLATAWLPRPGESDKQSCADIRLEGLIDLLKILDSGEN